MRLVLWMAMLLGLIACVPAAEPAPAPTSSERPRSRSTSKDDGEDASKGSKKGNGSKSDPVDDDGQGMERGSIAWSRSDLVADANFVYSFYAQKSFGSEVPSLTFEIARSTNGVTSAEQLYARWEANQGGAWPETGKKYAVDYDVSSSTWQMMMNYSKGSSIRTDASPGSYIVFTRVGSAHGEVVEAEYYFDIEGKISSGTAKTTICDTRVNTGLKCTGSANP